MVLLRNDGVWLHRLLCPLGGGGDDDEHAEVDILQCCASLFRREWGRAVAWVMMRRLTVLKMVRDTLQMLVILHHQLRAAAGDDTAPSPTILAHIHYRQAVAGCGCAAAAAHAAGVALLLIPKERQCGNSSRRRKKLRCLHRLR